MADYPPIAPALPGARLRFFIRTIPLAIGGGLLTATSPVPLEFTTMGFVGPAILLLAIEGKPRDRASWKRGFAAGWLFSLMINAVALYWVVGLLQVFAGFPWFAAVPTALLLWSAQAVPYGIAGAFAAALMGRGAKGYWVLPLCLVVAASFTPSLFPWRIGNSQIPWPLFIQLAELGGEPIIDLAVCLASCGALEFARSRNRLAGGLALAAFAIPTIYGAVRMPMVRAEWEAAPLVRVGVVQPNVGIFEKRDRSLAPRHLDELQADSAALERAGAEIIVWPESAYPYDIHRTRTHDFQDHRSVRGEDIGASVLFGTLSYDLVSIHPATAGRMSRVERLNARSRRYNSILAIDREGRITGIADKVELLAFGEYTPLWDYVPALQRNFGRGLTPGDEVKILELEGHRIGVLNCYEDVLPHYGITVGRKNPHFLVNATNDAWFGETSEPFLHQMVARMRSVETRRDLVRAVNTGVSSHTLPTGEDAIRTPISVRRRFIAEVHAMEGLTPWVRYGDLVSPALAGILLGAAFALRVRKVATG